MSSKQGCCSSILRDLAPLLCFPCRMSTVRWKKSPMRLTFYISTVWAFSRASMTDIWETYYSIPFLTSSTGARRWFLFIRRTAKRPRRRTWARLRLLSNMCSTRLAPSSILFLTGTLKRCPDIRFIVAHGGGTVPFLAQRISMLEGHRHAKGVTDVIPTLRALYYEIASTTAGYALRSLQELADPTHILWGSDLPFVYGERLQEEVDHWEEYDGFDAAARLGVEQQNALRLFPRFASAACGTSLLP